MNLIRAKFAPGRRLAVPFRGVFIWFVLYVVINARGMTTTKNGIPTVRRRGDATRFCDQTGSKV